MPLYRYIATDSKGEQVRGEATAISQGLLSRQLAASELKLVSAEPVISFNQTNQADSRRLSESQANEVLEFVTETIKSKLPMSTSLRLFAADVPDREIAAAMLSLATRLEAGAPLADAMKSLRIPAGMASLLTECRDANDLSLILSDHLSSEQPARSMRQLLALRLAYTGVQFCISVAVLFALAVILGALSAELFEEFNFNTSVSAATQILILFSKCMTTYWWAMLVGTLFIAIGAAILFSTVLLAPARDRILKPLTYPIALGRMLRTLAVLLENRRPLHESVRVAADVSANSLIQQPAYAFAYTLEQGQPISSAISGLTGFPPSMFDGLRSESIVKAAPASLRGIADYHDSCGRTRWVFFCFLIDIVVQIVTIAAFVLLIFVALVPLLQLINDLS